MKPENTNESKLTSVEAVEQKVEEQNEIDTEAEFYHTKKDLARIAAVFEQIGFRDFVNYLQSPMRIIWVNFWAGVFRGVGILIGMTVVIAIIIWFLTKLVDFPLIGSYFQQILDMFEQFAPGTNLR